MRGRCSGCTGPTVWRWRCGPTPPSLPPCCSWGPASTVCIYLHRHLSTLRDYGASLSRGRCRAGRIRIGNFESTARRSSTLLARYVFKSTSTADSKTVKMFAIQAVNYEIYTHSVIANKRSLKAK